MGNKKREQLLALFSEKRGEFISGEQMASFLGCSRTAVWKYMSALRKEGFIIEAVRNKGYRLEASTDQFSKDAISLGLKTKLIGQELTVLNVVESTQQVAHLAVSNGACSGAVIIADEQKGGKGRLKRSWDSQKGQGIWMSIILKPDIPLQKVPQFTFIASLAVTEAITQLTNLKAEIKWPNDVYIGKRKVCGVLTEMQADAESVHAVILGIGVNVNQVEFPDELVNKATSLKQELGTKVSRRKVIQAILFYLEKYYLLFIEQGFAPIKILWEERALSFGKTLRVTTMQEKITGVALGISDTGVLLVQDDTGKIHHIYSADIEMN
ncbi:biotin--[acetyl-CoA-carboxylase] ligase [Listeria sp. PSOL-1]|uniref:biotin--[acetyl-CoA-carboxylase] ligase n=1 Tax=Listeria sp. PSOL-1 TaxID=1844999 RepID=UPI0013D3D6F1|nr:biotin--[acetyl-CoA-carboxylase] ligase [Listeria sp. PSOL-1]